MSNYMKDMTPDFHCPFCPQKRLSWDAMMFHIGSSHPPDEDISDLMLEQKGRRVESLYEIARETENDFVVMVLSDEWIDVLRANVN